MADAQSLNYEPKIVAFLDILGFRRLVFQNRENARAVIHRLDESLSHCLKCMTMEAGDDWFSAKLFSDCFCISCQDENDYLGCLLKELAFTQWYLSIGGIFLSGGIASGHHFENERMIFSEGLINAYDLQGTPHYPRILISDAVRKRILSEPSEFYRNSLEQFLIRGPDDAVFLDYLQSIVEYSGYTGSLDEQLVAHKDAILEQVRANSSDHAILEKYRWLAEYHNATFAQVYDPEDWYEDYFQKLQEQVLVPMTVFPGFTKDAQDVAKP